MKCFLFSILIILFSANLQGGEVIKINAEKVQPPISKYIYGQFIEHLGRCIYGGIWAEMLEDRKFYYPITDHYNPWSTGSDEYWKAGDYKYLSASPWQVAGAAGTVFMDTIQPFTGKHAVIINVPGDGSYAGIFQDSLAVIQNKKYTGRIILAGEETVLPVFVRLVADNGKFVQEEIKTIHAQYQEYPLEYTAAFSSDRVKLEIVSRGKGKFKIGALSLMPADNLQGWRKDVVSLLRELNAPVYRWPGGNFVSGYNWRDGIGPRDKRPPRKNPAWKGIEHNDVGIHEYMDLMKMIDAEPFIAVNTGLGTVEELAEEVEYCNGSAESAMGRLRAQNGQQEPYNVQFWAVGNEMYGSWQLGYMPLEEYVKKHNLAAEAMWKTDPSIKLIGVGSVGEWSQAMLTHCSDRMNYISEHIYCQEKPDVYEHTRQLANDIKFKADAHRKYRSEIEQIQDKDIRIAMDEWNYWYGDYIYGELGVRYHHKDGLGVATGLHEYFRNSDLYFMANYAQTVNVIGCIKTNRTTSAFETTGLALKLYRNHFGTIPVEVSGNTGKLDIAAALTEDRTAITLAVVNPAPGDENIRFDFGKKKLKNESIQWMIRHNDPEAYNEPGKTPSVMILQNQVVNENNNWIIPGYSIIILRFEMI